MKGGLKVSEGLGTRRGVYADVECARVGHKLLVQYLGSKVFGYYTILRIGLLGQKLLVISWQ